MQLTEPVFMNDFAVKLERARQLLDAGQFEQAERLLLELYEDHAENAEVNFILAQLRRRLQDSLGALEFARKAVTAHPDDLGMRFFLAECLSVLERLDEAAGEFEKIIAQNPALFIAHMNLGAVYRQNLLTEKAEQAYLVALGLNPDDPATLSALGYVYSDQGRFDEAEQMFRRAIEKKPDFGLAHLGLASIRQHSEYGPETKALEALYQSFDLQGPDKADIGFALGKIFEDLKEYDKAFEFWSGANRRMHEHVPGNTSRSIENMENIIRFGGDVSDQSTAGPAESDITPVFLVGMVRSGTSLVEQILSTHSRVFGAGEVPTLDRLCQQSVDRFPVDLCDLTERELERIRDAYLDDLRSRSDGSDFVIDKSPSNFRLIGVLSRMLPAAKIIHCRRNAMDTCFSIYKRRFSGPAIAYTCDLEDLGKYYRQYEKLMSYWHSQLPGYIYDLSYEKLVADMPAQLRGVLDFIGLEFEPECLDFHRTQRNVATLSLAQVRKPIYGDSIDAWKRYEMQLEPLRKALGSELAGSESSGGKAATGLFGWLRRGR